MDKDVGYRIAPSCASCAYSEHVWDHKDGEISFYCSVHCEWCKPYYICDYFTEETIAGVAP